MTITFKRFLQENSDRLFKIQEVDEITIEDDPIRDVDAEGNAVEDDEITDEENVGMSDEEREDPNKEGMIRKIAGAHLVYKREDTNGTFEELWQYNTGDEIRDEIKIRRDILSGTDIPNDKKKSEDGSQSYELTTMGSAQLLHISGLPN